MMQMEPQDLMIRTLPTPNPFALKFVVNASVKEDGKATFNSPYECEDIPLARDMFSIDGVRQVYLFQNTLTITHTGELENDEMDKQVSAVLRTRMPAHNPKFGEPAKAVRRHAEEAATPELRAIEEILDRTIRPGLQADGGDVEVLAFDNNELKIAYQGACGGCPSSMMGTLDAIQGILRNELGNEALVVTPV